MPYTRLLVSMSKFFALNAGDFSLTAANCYTTRTKTKCTWAAVFFSFFALLSASSVGIILLSAEKDEWNKCEIEEKAYLNSGDELEKVQ